MTKGTKMNTQEVADYIGIVVGTLYNWRSNNPKGDPKRGPPFYQLGKDLFSYRDEVVKWCDKHWKPVAK